MRVPWPRIPEFVRNCPGAKFLPRNYSVRRRAPTRPAILLILRTEYDGPIALPAGASVGLTCAIPFSALPGSSASTARSAPIPNRTNQIASSTSEQGESRFSLHFNGLYGYRPWSNRAERAPKIRRLSRPCGSERRPRLGYHASLPVDMPSGLGNVCPWRRGQTSRDPAVAAGKANADLADIIITRGTG
jgi:hypothetical protein